MYSSVFFSAKKLMTVISWWPLSLNKIQRISLCFMFLCPKVNQSPKSISALGFFGLRNASPPSYLTLTSLVPVNSRDLAGFCFFLLPRVLRLTWGVHPWLLTAVVSCLVCVCRS